MCRSIATLIKELLAMILLLDTQLEDEKTGIVHVAYRCPQCLHCAKLAREAAAIKRSLSDG